MHGEELDGQGHEPLGDMLDFLDRGVWGEYQRLNTPDRIRLSITEVPELDWD